MKRVPIRALIEKEIIASIVFVALSLILAMKVGPGVGTSERAPLVAEAAAPWIFGPVQFLLFYFSPGIAALLFPFLVVSALISLPWINRFLGDQTSKGTFFTVCFILLALLLGFMLKERVMV